MTANQRPWQNIPTKTLTIGYILPQLITLFIYGVTLTFPAFYDTLINTQLADDLTLWTVWLPNEQFGFYRPLVFLPSVLMDAIFGGYSPLIGHLYNLLNHLLNLFLLTHLAQRLWQSPHRTILTGLLFAIAPFTFQSLAIHGNAAYLTVTAVILLTIHSSITHHALKPAHIIPLFIIGVLNNESAVLLVPIAFLFLLTWLPASEWRTVSFWRQNGWLIGLLTLYLLIYLFLPRGGGPVLDYGGNDPWEKLLILLQTAVYPFAWLTRYLPLSGSTIILIGTLLTSLLGIWAIWQDGSRLRPLLFTSGWWAGSVLLLAITLPTYYIADGARLFYLPSAALALGWAILLDSISHPTKQPRQLAFVASVLFITITSVRFAWDMMQTYRAVSTPFHTITETMANQPSEDGLVIANLPQWQAPQHPAYPVTTQFAPFMGEHLFAYELFRVNAGQARPIYTLVVPELLRETPYPYGVYQAFATDQLNEVESPRNHLFTYLYDPEQAGPTAVYRGIIERNFFPAAIPDFAGQTDPYTFLEATAVACNSQLDITIDLTAMHGGSENADTQRATTSIFVQAFTADWRLIGQVDGTPLDLPHGRIELWGTRIQDFRTIPLAEGDTAAHILVGTYDFITGERHPMQNNTGSPLQDNALFIPVQPCP